MPTFTYRAADRGGSTVTGVMEAPEARLVIQRLQRDAYFPIEVTEQAETAGRAGALPAPVGRRRVAGRDLVAFTQQLATLLEAGLPLDRTLAIQAELAPTAHLRSITAAILTSVRGGTSLAEALAAHYPRPFSRLYVNMVRAGEAAGLLEATLKRLAEFLEEAQEFRDALLSALIYPALLTGVGTAAVVFLMTFVIPRFADIFRDLGGAIPLPTQVLLAVSSWLQRYWWAFALLGLAGAVAIRTVLTHPTGRLRVDAGLLRLPLVRDLVIKTEVARFARILGTLLKSGVALIPALAVVTDMLSNQVLLRATERLGEGVRRGAGLHAPMAESGLFPSLAVHMVRVGEESGRLDDMLLKVGLTFEADTRKQLKRLVALAEPCIILVMGLLVGFIVVAMLLAIFSISEIPL